MGGEDQHLLVRVPGPDTQVAPVAVVPAVSFAQSFTLLMLTVPDSEEDRLARAGEVHW